MSDLRYKPLASFTNESPVFGSESLFVSVHSKWYQLLGYPVLLGSITSA